MQVKIFKGFTDKDKYNNELEDEINFWLNKQEGKIKILNTHSSMQCDPTSYKIAYFYVVEYEEIKDRYHEMLLELEEFRCKREQQEEAHLKAEMEELRRREADDKIWKDFISGNYSPKQDKVTF